MSNHFMPQGVYKHFESPFAPNSVRYEGLKKQFNSELMATEACMTKCSAVDGEANFTSDQSNCLRECTLKYFDSTLLIEYEMRNYARGVPL
jgi:hypothetical protein